MTTWKKALRLRTEKKTQHHIECVCGRNVVYPATSYLSWSKLRRTPSFGRQTNHPKKQKDGTFTFFIYTYERICPGHGNHNDESEWEGQYDDHE